jgi:hypothetical protein
MRGNRLEGADDLPQPLSWYLFLDQHDPVEVIGHHHYIIKNDVMKSARQFLPSLEHHASGCIVVQFSLYDVSEEAVSILGADGYEVATGLGVVIVRKTERRAAPWRVIMHAPAV